MELLSKKRWNESEKKCVIISQWDQAISSEQGSEGGGASQCLPLKHIEGSTEKGQQNEVFRRIIFEGNSGGV
jgi:hypothetical protein